MILRGSPPQTSEMLRLSVMRFKNHTIHRFATKHTAILCPMGELLKENGSHILK